jgi:hypothetical protein
MARYILIDNCSGYIWGDSGEYAPGTDITGPIHAARMLDYDLGEQDRRYEECRRSQLASNETGYHVYRASNEFPAVDDGRASDTIMAVESDCEYVTTLRCSEAP